MLRRLLCTGFPPLILLAAAASCALNEPPVTDVLSQSPDGGSLAPRPIDAGVPVAVDPIIPEEVLPAGCSSGDTRTCGPSTGAGECTLGQRVCVDGVWGDCIGAVYPTARLCGEKEDRNCDGLPDDMADAVCECVPDTSEPCDPHPGQDGVGACTAGVRTCVTSPDRLSSRWGACTGAVGPAAMDSCLIKGDDANCDATPNSGCTCVEGDVIACGPSDVGICRRGTSACVNLQFTECTGAILPLARDCSSSADNDCDGIADDTIDDVCTCEVGSVEACSVHPEDGVGLCQAGERTCVTGSGRSSSAFGACTGAVGPAARSCNSSADNDCDGSADNTIDATCACSIGATQLCQQHVGLDGVGRCRAGQQLCVAGPNNATSAFGVCSGSVGPLAADSCTVLGDDANCDGTPNGGCACVAGQGNGPCASRPNASRCDATGACVACTVNADCSLVAGLPACSGGVCVQCTADAQCGAGGTCNLTSHTCEALAPPPDIDAGG